MRRTLAFAFVLLQTLPLVGRQAGTVSGIPFCLADPPAERLTVQPTFSATDRIVAHGEGCSWA